MEGAKGEYGSGNPAVQILNQRQPAAVTGNRDTHRSYDCVPQKSETPATRAAQGKRGGGIPPLADRITPEHKHDIPTPTQARRPKKLDGKKVNTATSHDDKPRKPAEKLESYAGQGASVEFFLAKFESHVTYFRWSEQDRVFQLKNSLTGTAAQALWTGGEHATFAKLIKLLHSRHGSKQQTKRFWSKLRVRRRRKDEPLQDVCQDIKRLMYLASPHETGPLVEHISIDHYVPALGDPNMRMFVMSRDPVMLEDAF